MADCVYITAFAGGLPLGWLHHASRVIIFLEIWQQLRRRIHTEEKAKVVAVAWRTELLQIFAALAILQKDDLKTRVQISLFFNTSCSAKYLAMQELKKFCPPRSSDDLCLLFCKNYSSLVWKYRYQWRADDLLKIYIYFLPPDVKWNYRERK